MPETHKIAFTFAPRVASEHLGRQKYTTPGRALGELVANAFDADAARVDIEIEVNDLGVESALVVSDDGRGMSLELLRTRFAVVGVDPTLDGRQRFGRLGVGRLAVHRIGTVSDWETVSETPDGTKVRCMFTLDVDRPRDVDVTIDAAPSTTNLGTTIRIENLNDAGRASLASARVSGDLLNQFCSYLLSTSGREIRVNGVELNVRELVREETVEDLVLPHDIRGGASVRHLVLATPATTSRFEGQVLYTAKGRTVHSEDPELSLSPNYLAVAQCDYLDTVVTANRESLIEFDEGFAALRSQVLDRVEHFQDKLRAERSRRFIEGARERPYYPYRSSPRDAVSAASQALYDVVLERVHEHANLERMTQAQQAVVFRLLRRAVENEDLLEILEEVAGLSDQDLEQFRRVLEKTTLQSIIRLSGEVAGRMEFLRLLHELVYGEPGRYLRERTEFHRILEPHCWLFGERFHLATSDQTFRAVIAAHREEAGLPPATDLDHVNGLDQVPDLFLATEREYGVHHPTEHLLVEIKAPNVKVGTKEVAQIRRYAEVIRKSPQFDQDRVRWHLYVVSSDIADQVDEDRHQKDRESGILFLWPNMTVWAFRWSEIARRSTDELNLVSKHLERKSSELSVSKFLQESFPDVLQSLSERIADRPS
jgi:hypothetical protein